MRELEGEKVEIIDVSSEGMGIAKIEQRVIFVKKAMAGDVVVLKNIKKKKKFIEADIAEIVSPSAARIEPVCKHFGVCGGCKWQYISYDEQKKYKHKIVKDALERIGKIEVGEMLPIVGCEQSLGYRNKLEFAFTDRKWLTNEEIESGEDFDRRGVGFHVPESFSGVVDILHCHLQADLSNQIRLAAKHFAMENDFVFFDLKNQTGFMRNLMVRITSIGEILVLFSFGENDKEKIKSILDFILMKFPMITSLQFVINPKRNDTIYDLSPVVFFGTPQIKEKLGDYYFYLGPKSFFQTNTAQANKLYAITKDFAGIEKNDIVYDLYTGGEHVKHLIRRSGLIVPGACHLFRHACATHMLENGADIRYIQALLGHASLTSTQIYTNVSLRKLKEIHEATHPARLRRAGGDEAAADGGRPRPEPAQTVAAVLDALACEEDDEA